MRQIAILAGLTLALVLLAVDGAGAEDCYATNCTIGSPQNVTESNNATKQAKDCYATNCTLGSPQNMTESKSGADPKLDNAMKQLSKDTERALTAPKPEPTTEPTKPGEQPSVRLKH